MKLGMEASDLITKTFERPINLEFEKVYYPFLLISKKRYAGLIWTNDKTYDKMDTKGIETVRRDNCLLVKAVVTTSLNKLLIDRDVKGAVEYVKGMISDLLMHKVDLSMLVVTKALSQNAEDYGNKAAHVELAKRMLVRDAATAPTVGDRIAYVIIKAAKGAKAWEKAEDPIYALDHNLPIDAQHYLEHYLMQPLIRIFGPIVRHPTPSFLQGEYRAGGRVHMPSRVVPPVRRHQLQLYRKAALPTYVIAISSLLCCTSARSRADVHAGYAGGRGGGGCRWCGSASLFIFPHVSLPPP